MAHRSARRSREAWWSRFTRAVQAVLVAAMLVVGLPMPAAVADGTPDPVLSEPAGDIADRVNEILADPLLRLGMEAHDRLNMWDPGRNLAIVLFDLTGFQKSHLKNLEKWFGAEKKKAQKWPDPVGDMRLFKREGREELFDHLGMAKDGVLLEVAAVNTPKDNLSEEEDEGEHSEPAIYRVLSLILQSPYLDIQGDELKSVKGGDRDGYSDRDRCKPCREVTKGIDEKGGKFKFLVDYTTRADRSSAWKKLDQILPYVKFRLEKEKREKKKQAKAAMPGPAGSTTHCSSMGRGAGGPVMGMSLQLAAADPCDEDGGSARGGAIDQALASADSNGGVDFSTLEMRYISDTSDGIQYAYAAQPLPGGYQQDNNLGTRVVKNLGDDLRTWLVLDPQKFWVNLNPTEPDRIVDPALGQTNAGKAMLEADLQMKRTEAKILHPDSETGAKYWQQLQSSSDGALCFSSRMWIVPGQVEVREDGGSLYILKALLDVKTKSENIDDPYSQGCKTDPATDAHHEELERTLVLPEVIKAVNTDPEYAPLRRAFMARIIAQWARERHQQGHRTAFDDIIDSKELGPARLEDGWRPKQVFDDYVRSYRDHEFDITRESTDGGVQQVTRYVFGGADLTNVRLTGVTEADARQRYPQVTRAAQDSVTRQVTAPDGSIWLGGTVQAPEQGFWDQLKVGITRLTGGNGLLLTVLLLALGGVLFGFRTRRGARTG
ncbi:hypothetical protein [Kitasatospora sp. NPDC058046]|uniref:hypothetical protein n=1 Tax=Kitasatospora sp. NPDC058046 TaxID=3346312 RepID=UPI0036DA4272